MRTAGHGMQIYIHSKWIMSDARPDQAICIARPVRFGPLNSAGHPPTNCWCGDHTNTGRHTHPRAQSSTAGPDVECICGEGPRCSMEHIAARARSWNAIDDGLPDCADRNRGERFRRRNSLPDFAKDNCHCAISPTTNGLARKDGNGTTAICRGLLRPVFNCKLHRPAGSPFQLHSFNPAPLPVNQLFVFLQTEESVPLPQKLSCLLLHPVGFDGRAIGQNSRVMAVVPPAPSSSEFSRHLNRLQQTEDVIIGSSVLSNSSAKDHLLVVSPYEEASHLLDLRTVDTANQLLAKALVGLKCLRDDYATAPYVEIFNVSLPRIPSGREKMRSTLSSQANAS
jgi:hypothetical protein